jgi:predicted RNA binding protein YcfA (HicA-like mRNA interferase family)
MAALRPIHYQELVRVFERDGFRYNRQEGDHLIYVKSAVKRPIVIPMYRAVPVFIIKNLMRTAGMSRERYFELLNQT